MERDPRVDWLLEQAHLKLVRKHTADAARLLREALRLDPRNQLAARLLAEAEPRTDAEVPAAREPFFGWGVRVGLWWALFATAYTWSYFWLPFWSPIPRAMLYVAVPWIVLYFPLGALCYGLIGKLAARVESSMLSVENAGLLVGFVLALAGVTCHMVVVPHFIHPRFLTGRGEFPWAAGAAVFSRWLARSLGERAQQWRVTGGEPGACEVAPP